MNKVIISQNDIQRRKVTPKSIVLDEGKINRNGLIAEVKMALPLDSIHWVRLVSL